MTTTGIILFTLGFTLGGLILWILSRNKLIKYKEENRHLSLKIKHQDDLRKEREEIIKNASSPLTQAFQEISNKSLQSNSENFLRLAEENLNKHQQISKSELKKREKAIEGLINPIEKELNKIHEQNSKLEKTRSEAYGGIKAQLQEMQKTNKSLFDETNNLVNALKRPEVRGRWGEITLKRLVELAGMVEHCDFVEQVHSKSDDSIIRPDMIIRMPDKRDLVVDVKTPLDAYLKAIETPDKDKQKILLQKHSSNVKDHIKKLSAKNYWDQFENSPEFVILFIPGDQFLSSALNEDTELIEFALSRQIILATPTSFIALLKAINYGWRQLVLTDNADTIRRLAENLHSRLSAFSGHMDKLGYQLSNSIENFNKAVGSLERNVLPGARKFKDLGANPTKELKELNQIEAIVRKPSKE